MVTFRYETVLTGQLPADASPTEEVKHVDSALEEIKENDPLA